MYRKRLNRRQNRRNFQSGMYHHAKNYVAGGLRGGYRL